MRPVANQPESQTTPCKSQRPNPARRLRHHVRPWGSVHEFPESPHFLYLRSALSLTQSANPPIQFLESGECADQAAARQRSMDCRLAQHFSVRASPAPLGSTRLAPQTPRDEKKRLPTRPLCFRFAAMETPSPTVFPADAKPRHWPVGRLAHHRNAELAAFLCIPPSDPTRYPAVHPTREHWSRRWRDTAFLHSAPKEPPPRSHPWPGTLAPQFR